MYIFTSGCIVPLFVLLFLFALSHYPLPFYFSLHVIKAMAGDLVLSGGGGFGSVELYIIFYFSVGFQNI
uniref:Uncharacterized protein n=1 Tax=Cannabis sativa TaxID=3483 RepID=A0A803QVU6_CANSA